MKQLLQISKGIKKMVIVLVMALIIVSTGNARTVYAEGLHELSEDNSVMLESVEKCDDYITKTIATPQARIIRSLVRMFHIAIVRLWVLNTIWRLAKFIELFIRMHL